MKYKSMQVKEIPIVFRGTVAAGAGESVYDKTNAVLDINDLNYSLDQMGYNAGENLGSRFTNGENLYILFGDELYGPLTATIAQQGNTETTLYGDVGLSNYPFAFAQIYIMDKLDPVTRFEIIAETPDNTDVTIWATEPTHTETPGVNKQVFCSEITGNGQVKQFNVRFALGENGTLHIKPYVILNGNIKINLADFASGGDQFIAGDNETISFDCFVPVETHARICIEAENVGSYASILDAWAVVQYEEYIEEDTIVGYEGVNLRRGRR